MKVKITCMMDDDLIFGSRMPLKIQEVSLEFTEPVCDKLEVITFWLPVEP